MLQRLQSNILVRIEKLAASIESLTLRCTALEKGIGQFRGELPSKLQVDTAALLTTRCEEEAIETAQRLCPCSPLLPPKTRYAKTPAQTMGAKLSDLKGFSTPSPSAYRPEDCKEEKAAIAFGIKHSPYVGSLKGDSFVRARTETVKAAVQTQEDFRPRSGTFTKTERPTIIKTIRTTTQLSQPVA